jgi:hypothetical protein
MPGGCTILDPSRLFAVPQLKHHPDMMRPGGPQLSGPRFSPLQVFLRRPARPRTRPASGSGARLYAFTLGLQRLLPERATGRQSVWVMDGQDLRVGDRDLFCHYRRAIWEAPDELWERIEPNSPSMIRPSAGRGGSAVSE